MQKEHNISINSKTTIKKIRVKKKNTNIRRLTKKICNSKEF